MGSFTDYTENKRYYGPGSSPYQVVVDGQKLCSKCETWKPLEEFNRTAKRATGRTAECKACFRRLPSQHGERRRKASREWYRRSGMDRLRVKLYGVTPDEYAAMLAAQAGGCAICGSPPSEIRDGHLRPLAVDHCHESGLVRGLLCGNCNVAIGMLRHDVALLDKARAYLESTG